MVQTEINGNFNPDKCPEKTTVRVCGDLRWNSDNDDVIIKRKSPVNPRVFDRLAKVKHRIVAKNTDGIQAGGVAKNGDGKPTAATPSDFEMYSKLNKYNNSTANSNYSLEPQVSKAKIQSENLQSFNFPVEVNRQGEGLHVEIFNDEMKRKGKNQIVGICMCEFPKRPFDREENNLEEDDSSEDTIRRNNTDTGTICACQYSEQAYMIQNNFEIEKYVSSPDMYRSILGPTPDEVILAGLQTIIDICCTDDREQSASTSEYSSRTPKELEWETSQTDSICGKSKHQYFPSCSCSLLDSESAPSTKSKRRSQMYPKQPRKKSQKGKNQGQKSRPVTPEDFFKVASSKTCVCDVGDDATAEPARKRGKSETSESEDSEKKRKRAKKKKESEGDSEKEDLSTDEEALRRLLCLCKGKIPGLKLGKSSEEDEDNEVTGGNSSGGSGRKKKKERSDWKSSRSEGSASEEFDPFCRNYKTSAGKSKKNNRIRERSSGRYSSDANSSDALNLFCGDPNCEEWLKLQAEFLYNGVEVCINPKCKIRSDKTRERRPGGKKKQKYCFSDVMERLKKCDKSRVSDSQKDSSSDSYEGVNCANPYCEFHEATPDITTSESEEKPKDTSLQFEHPGPAKKKLQLVQSQQVDISESPHVSELDVNLPSTPEASVKDTTFIEEPLSPIESVSEPQEESQTIEQSSQTISPAVSQEESQEITPQPDSMVPLQETPVPSEAPPSEKSQTSPVQSKTSPAQSQTSPAQSQTSPVQSQTSPVQSQTSPVQSQTSPVQSQGSPAQSQTSPVLSQGSPAQSQTSPVPSQTSPIPSQGSPAQSQTSPVPSQSPVQSKETSPPGSPVKSSQESCDCSIKKGKVDEITCTCDLNEANLEKELKIPSIDISCSCSLNSQEPALLSPITSVDECSCSVGGASLDSGLSNQRIPGRIYRRSLDVVQSRESRQRIKYTSEKDRRKSDQNSLRSDQMSYDDSVDCLCESSAPPQRNQDPAKSIGRYNKGRQGVGGDAYQRSYSEDQINCICSSYSIAEEKSTQARRRRDSKEYESRRNFEERMRGRRSPCRNSKEGDVSRRTSSTDKYDSEYEISKKNRNQAKNSTEMRSSLSVLEEDSNCDCVSTPAKSLQSRIYCSDREAPCRYDDRSYSITSSQETCISCREDRTRGGDVPGRNDYSDAAIYKKGERRGAVDEGSRKCRDGSRSRDRVDSKREICGERRRRGSRDESRRESRDESRRGSRDEGRRESRDESRRGSRDEGRRESRGESRKGSRDESRRVSRDGSRRSRDESRRESRDESRRGSRDESRRGSRDGNKRENLNRSLQDNLDENRGANLDENEINRDESSRVIRDENAKDRDRTSRGSRDESRKEKTLSENNPSEIISTGKSSERRLSRNTPVENNQRDELSSQNRKSSKRLSESRSPGDKRYPDGKSEATRNFTSKRVCADECYLNERYPPKQKYPNERSLEARYEGKYSEEIPPEKRAYCTRTGTRSTPRNESRSDLKSYSKIDPEFESKYPRSKSESRYPDSKRAGTGSPGMRSPGSKSPTTKSLDSECQEKEVAKPNQPYAKPRKCKPPDSYIDEETLEDEIDAQILGSECKSCAERRQSPSKGERAPARRNEETTSARNVLDDINSDYRSLSSMSPDYRTDSRRTPSKSATNNLAEYRSPGYKNNEYKSSGYISVEQKRAACRSDDCKESDYRSKYKSISQNYRSPEYKPPDYKNNNYKSSDLKSPNCKSADCRTIDSGKPDCRSPDYRSSDYISPNYRSDYRTPDYRTPDYRTPDYRTPDYRSPDYRSSNKKSDYKIPDYRSLDYKSPSSRSPDYRSPDNKSTGYKSAEYNTTECTIPHCRSSEIKPTDYKSYKSPKCRSPSGRSPVSRKSSDLCADQDGETQTRRRSGDRRTSDSGRSPKRCVPDDRPEDEPSNRERRDKKDRPKSSKYSVESIPCPKRTKEKGKQEAGEKKDLPESEEKTNSGDLQADSVDLTPVTPVQSYKDSIPANIVATSLIDRQMNDLADAKLKQKDVSKRKIYCKISSHREEQQEISMTRKSCSNATCPYVEDDLSLVNEFISDIEDDPSKYSMKCECRSSISHKQSFLSRDSSCTDRTQSDFSVCSDYLRRKPKCYESATEKRLKETKKYKKETCPSKRRDSEVFSDTSVRCYDESRTKRSKDNNRYKKEICPSKRRNSEVLSDISMRCYDEAAVRRLEENKKRGKEICRPSRQRDVEIYSDTSIRCYKENSLNRLEDIRKRTKQICPSKRRNLDVVSDISVRCPYEQISSKKVACPREKPKKVCSKTYPYGDDGLVSDMSGMLESDLEEVKSCTVCKKLQKKKKRSSCRKETCSSRDLREPEKDVAEKVKRERSCTEDVSPRITNKSEVYKKQRRLYIDDSCQGVAPKLSEPSTERIRKKKKCTKEIRPEKEEIEGECKCEGEVYKKKRSKPSCESVEGTRIKKDGVVRKPSVGRKSSSFEMKKKCSYEYFKEGRAGGKSKVLYSDSFDMKMKAKEKTILKYRDEVSEDKLGKESSNIEICNDNICPNKRGVSKTRFEESYDSIGGEKGEKMSYESYQKAKFASAFKAMEVSSFEGDDDGFGLKRDPSGVVMERKSPINKTREWSENEMSKCFLPQKPYPPPVKMDIPSNQLLPTIKNPSRIEQKSRPVPKPRCEVKPKTQTEKFETQPKPRQAERKPVRCSSTCVKEIDSMPTTQSICQSSVDKIYRGLTICMKRPKAKTKSKNSLSSSTDVSKVYIPRNARYSKKKCSPYDQIEGGKLESQRKLDDFSCIFKTDSKRSHRDDSSRCVRSRNPAKVSVSSFGVYDYQGRKCKKHLDERVVLSMERVKSQEVKQKESADVETKSNRVRSRCKLQACSCPSGKECKKKLKCLSDLKQKYKEWREEVKSSKNIKCKGKTCEPGKCTVRVKHKSKEEMKRNVTIVNTALVRMNSPFKSNNFSFENVNGRVQMKNRKERILVKEGRLIGGGANSYMILNTSSIDRKNRDRRNYEKYCERMRDRSRADKCDCQNRKSNLARAGGRRIDDRKVKWSVETFVKSLKDNKFSMNEIEHLLRHRSSEKLENMIPVLSSESVDKFLNSLKAARERTKRTERRSPMLNKATPSFEKEIARCICYRSRHSDDDDSRYFSGESTKQWHGSRTRSNSSGSEAPCRRTVSGSSSDEWTRRQRSKPRYKHTARFVSTIKVPTGRIIQRCCSPCHYEGESKRDGQGRRARSEETRKRSHFDECEEGFGPNHRISVRTNASFRRVKNVKSEETLSQTPIFEDNEDYLSSNASKDFYISNKNTYVCSKHGVFEMQDENDSSKEEDGNKDEDNSSKEDETNKEENTLKTGNTSKDDGARTDTTDLKATKTENNSKDEEGSDEHPLKNPEANSSEAQPPSDPDDTSTRTDANKKRFESQISFEEVTTKIYETKTLKMSKGGAHRTNDKVMVERNLSAIAGKEDRGVSPKRKKIKDDYAKVKRLRSGVGSDIYSEVDVVGKKTRRSKTPDRESYSEEKYSREKRREEKRARRDHGETREEERGKSSSPKRENGRNLGKTKLDRDDEDDDDVSVEIKGKIVKKNKDGKDKVREFSYGKKFSKDNERKREGEDDSFNDDNVDAGKEIKKKREHHKIDPRSARGERRNIDIKSRVKITKSDDAIEVESLHRISKTSGCTKEEMLRRRKNKIKPTDENNSRKKNKKEEVVEEEDEEEILQQQLSRQDVSNGKRDEEDSKKSSKRDSESYKQEISLLKEAANLEENPDRVEAINYLIETLIEKREDMKRKEKSPKRKVLDNIGKNRKSHQMTASEEKLTREKALLEKALEGETDSVRKEAMEFIIQDLMVDLKMKREEKESSETTDTSFEELRSRKVFRERGRTVFVPRSNPELKKRKKVTCAKKCYIPKNGSSKKRKKNLEITRSSGNGRVLVRRSRGGMDKNASVVGWSRAERKWRPCVCEAGINVTKKDLDIENVDSSCECSSEEESSSVSDSSYEEEDDRRGFKVEIKSSHKIMKNIAVGRSSDLITRKDFTARPYPKVNNQNSEEYEFNTSTDIRYGNKSRNNDLKLNYRRVSDSMQVIPNSTPQSLNDWKGSRSPKALRGKSDSKKIKNDDNDMAVVPSSSSAVRKPKNIKYGYCRIILFDDITAYEIMKTNGMITSSQDVNFKPEGVIVLRNK